MSDENRHKLRPICWASMSNGCRGDLTKEHVVSESVLKIIGALNVGKDGEKPITLGTGSYVLKRLCNHHNSALSKYDEEAQKFFSALKSISEMLREEPKPNKLIETNCISINKRNLERWFAKTFMNMVLFNIPVFKPDNLPLYVTPHSIIDQLYKGKDFEQPFGLYLINPAKSLVPENQVGFKIFQSKNAHIISRALRSN